MEVKVWKPLATVSEVEFWISVNCANEEWGLMFINCIIYGAFISEIDKQ